MRTLIVAFSVALFAGRGIGAQDPSTAKKSPPSANTKKTAAKSTATAKSAQKKQPVRAATAPKPQTAAASSQAAHRRAPSKSTTSKTQVVRRPSQQQPTPERYKEIQQALADKGYFNGPADGQWGPESVEALKRFQREQNLTDDGKIGSLSLIALGLGPKRGPAAEPTPEKAQQR